MCYFGWEDPFTVLPVSLVKQLKCLCKIFAKFAAKFHTHTRCSSSPFIVTLSIIQRAGCACAQFSRCGSTTNAHSETGHMAVCCQNLTLDVLSGHSILSVLVGELFKKFGLFLNTPCTSWLGGLLISDIQKYLSIFKLKLIHVRFSLINIQNGHPNSESTFLVTGPCNMQLLHGIL
jgi:hypothetical protein